MEFVAVINHRRAVNYFDPVKRLLQNFTEYEIKNT